MKLLTTAVLTVTIATSALAERERDPGQRMDESAGRFAERTALSEATVGADAELGPLRDQFVAWHTAAGSDPSGRRMREALDSLEGTARWATAPGFLLSNGSWSDIDYGGEPSGSWGPWDHTRRLIVMARAYQTPGQGLYKDPLLRSQIEAALTYTKTFYGAWILPTGNWWFWTIGIPIDLGPTLVLMQGEVDQQTFDDLVLAIRLRIGSSPTSRGIVGPVPTGQNLVWSSWTHLCLGLVQSDTARLTTVREAMASVARPAAGEGIKLDRSFHQHGAQLYTGGYGGAFANDVARYAMISRDTAWQLPADALASFADYVADGIAWSLHGSYFDVSVVGREVARPTTTGYNGLAALLQASRFPSHRRSDIRSAAAKMLQSWNGGLPLELAGAATQLESEQPAAAWPAGHRHYPASDYTVHRRDGWMASIKMFSKRTKSGESTNNENLFGARQSDGRFHLTFAGDEFQTDVWPAFDWSRMPGTTVEQKADTANTSFGYGMNSLAGGTGDGRNGVSAMDLVPLNSSLRARKSWFFFDDSIVFLTNGISSTSANPVETIVSQWPLADPGSTVTRRDDWAVAGKAGYWFPASQNVTITTPTRSGTWASLGGSTDSTVHTKTFATMLFEHGRTPFDASAEYVIVPGATPASMAAWAASRPLSILANNRSVSAVRDLRTGELGITFWQAAAIDDFRSSAPLVVWVRREGDRMQVWAADPNAGSTGTIQLAVSGNWEAAGVQAQRSGGTTVLSIPRASGATAVVVLDRIKGRRRAS